MQLRDVMTPNAEVIPPDATIGDAAKTDPRTHTQVAHHPLKGFSFWSFPINVQYPVGYPGGSGSERGEEHIKSLHRREPPQTHDAMGWALSRRDLRDRGRRYWVRDDDAAGTNL